MKNLGIDYVAIYDAGGNCVFSETIASNNEIIQELLPELDSIIHDSIVIEGVIFLEKVKTEYQQFT